MIRKELRVTLDRIRYFRKQVEKVREVEATPENFRASTGGYLDEIDRLNLNVCEYLILSSR